MKSIISTDKKTSTGFSLIEMSVVIIVISLLLAAVLGGNTLIKGAKIRAAINEIGQYKVSINSFYAKFNALPGDFDEAQIYWGTDEITDGDANGHIEFQNEDGVYEGYNAWQHLSNERMIDIPLSGTQTDGVANLNSDVPEARMGGAYFLDYEGFNFTDNILILGKPSAPDTSTTPESIRLLSSLTPDDAQDIDAKLDDGTPNNGSFRAQEGFGAAVNSCISVNGAIYNLENETKTCIAAVRISVQ